jgi:preprotein translocase subunit YajC
MPGLFDGLSLLFAQNPDNTGGWSSLLILLPVPFLFYFMIYLPQRQQEKKRRSMIDALKKNDKVLTAGGIFGTVISVDPAADRMVLRIDDDKGVKMTLTRSSVVRVVDSTSEKSAEAS